MRSTKISGPRREEAQKLWQYCFEDTPEFTSWYLGRRAGDIYAVDGDDGIIAQVVTVPVDFMARGVKKSGRLLSGIATAPHHRLKGHMGALLPECMGLLRDEGAAFAGLYPFDYAFYEHYGFARSADIIKARVSISRLPKARIAGAFEMARGEEAAVKLNEAYEACFSGYSGRVIRGVAGFLLRLEEHAMENGHAAVYRGTDGRLKGYLLYKTEGREIFALEAAAADREARMSLLAFIGAHSPTADTVRWTEPNYDPLWRLLPDPRGIATLEPHTMMRILDIGAALGGIPCGNGEVTLTVNDNKLPVNSGCWRISGESGSLSASRVGCESAQEISINDLTQWVIGYTTAHDLRLSGCGIDEKTADIMDGMLCATRAFSYDMY